MVKLSFATALPHADELALSTQRIPAGGSRSSAAGSPLKLASTLQSCQHDRKRSPSTR